MGVEHDGIVFVSLPCLVEMKLASGMSLVTRAKDIGDVVGLIQALDLPEDFAAKLNPYVRPKYAELWAAVQSERREP